MLLVFMDYQARRHFQKQVGFDSNSIEYARARAYEARDSLEKPVRTTASELLGQTRQVLQQKTKSIHDDLKTTTQSRIRGQTDEIIKGIHAHKIDNPGQDFPVHYIQPTPSSMNLYFIRFRRGRAELVSVNRKISKQSLTLGEVLKILQNGPTLREPGLINAFTHKIKIYSVTKDKNRVIVDLSENVGQMGSHVIRDRLDQLVFTLTQFPDIDSVVLHVEGQAIDSLGNSRIKIPAQINRNNRKVFVAN